MLKASEAISHLVSGQRKVIAALLFSAKAAYGVFVQVKEGFSTLTPWTFWMGWDSSVS